MSYILDALRRADAERGRGAVPGLHTQAAPTSGASSMPGQAGPINLWFVAAGVVGAAALAAGGTEASMRPSFPTKTFPNHWAIVTGDRPDRSGIVANNMEDDSRPKDKFTMASDDPYWWNEAEPIWITAEKQGVRTATMFWPGSNVAWGGNKAAEWPYRISGGSRPSDWAQFNEAISPTQRVNGVLDVLRRPADIRPRFVTLYFDEVDTAGHNNGPAAP